LFGAAVAVLTVCFVPFFFGGGGLV